MNQLTNVDSQLPATIDEQPRMVCALDSSPRHKFEMMRMIAEESARAIKASGFTSHIQGRDYVLVEGWSMIGLAWGCTARERDVSYVEGLGWVAQVDIVRLDTGAVIGGASHICGDDEAVWQQRDTYAKRSMAVTRAVGKAFRMMFSATVKMAGYEPTPAEEMPHVEAPPPAPKKPARKKKASAQPTPPPANPDSGAVEADPTDLQRQTRERLVGMIAAQKSETKLEQLWRIEIKGAHAAGSLTDGQLENLRVECGMQRELLKGEISESDDTPF